MVMSNRCRNGAEDSRVKVTTLTPINLKSAWKKGYDLSMGVFGQHAEPIEKGLANND